MVDSTSRCNESLFGSSPHRGEMFIAWRSFFSPQLRRSAIAFACLGNRSAAGFAPKGARSLGCALVAIDISLLWSENEFDCCTSNLNPRNAKMQIANLFSSNLPFIRCHDHLVLFNSDNHLRSKKDT